MRPIPNRVALAGSLRIRKVVPRTAGYPPPRDVQANRGNARSRPFHAVDGAKPGRRTAASAGARRRFAEPRIGIP